MAASGTAWSHLRSGPGEPASYSPSALNDYGIRQDIRRSHRYSWMFTGWMVDRTLSEEEGGTEFVTIGVPDDFVAVRVGFANINRDAWTVRDMVACASSRWGDFFTPWEPGHGHRPPSAWSPVTFHNRGVDSATLVSRPEPASEIIVAGNKADPATGDASNPAWTFTDWVPCQSVGEDPATGMRVLMLRAFIPGGQTVTFTNGRLIEHTAAPLINRGYLHFVGGLKHGADWVRNREPLPDPGITTSVIDGNHLVNGQMMCLIQVMTRHAGIVGMVVGDSHQSGTGTSTGFNNFVARTMLDLGEGTKGKFPMGLASVAAGGIASAQFFPRMSALLHAVRPSFVVLPGWSANDRDGEVSANEHAENMVFTRMLMALDEIRDAGATPVLMTPFPRDPLFMNQDVMKVWRQRRAEILSFRDQGLFVIDAAEVLGSAENGELTGHYSTGLTSDSIHPNDSGHDRLAILLKNHLCQTLAASSSPLSGSPDRDHRPSSGLLGRLLGR